MARIHIAAIITILCITLASWGEVMAHSPETGMSGSNEQSEMLNKSFEIPESDAENLKMLALKGDGGAAHRISMNYFMVKHDPAKGIYWLIVAAENGHAPGMYNLANHMANTGSSEERVRAAFWFKKVIASGEQPFAREAIQRLAEMDGEK